MSSELEQEAQRLWKKLFLGLHAEESQSALYLSYPKGVTAPTIWHRGARLVRTEASKALEGVNASDVRLAFAYRVPVGTQELRLPLMQVAPGVAICLLMTIDEEIEAMRQLSADLASILPQDVDAVASAATLGIQVGACVAQSLGLPRQYVLQKTDKKHLSDALVCPLSSITTANSQMLRLDRRWIAHLRGKRVVFVDDVLSTGGSCSAALSLLRAAGAHVVGVGAILVEGNSWRSKLGDDQYLVKYLAKVPIFKHNSVSWIAVWE